MIDSSMYLSFMLIGLYGCIIYIYWDYFMYKINKFLRKVKAKALIVYNVLISSGCIVIFAKDKSKDKSHSIIASLEVESDELIASVLEELIALEKKDGENE